MIRAAVLATLSLLLGSQAHARTGDDDSAAAAVRLARAAVRRAGAHPDLVRSWLLRLRASAWVPEVRVGFEKDLGTRESIDQTDRTRYGTYALDHFRFDVRATWRFDRALFDPEEVRIGREAARLAELRRELSLQVVRLFFERRRLRVESEQGIEEGSRAAATRAARIDELSAALLALCGDEAEDR